MAHTNPDIEKEIVITGLGIISAIGNNLDDNLRSLRQDKTGLAPIHRLETTHKNEYVAGEVKLSNKELNNTLNIKANLPRTTLLALTAAHEALSSAKFSGKPENKNGVILGR
ncbi:hypothetical protein ES705_37340 [subsurface metagenome]